MVPLFFGRGGHLRVEVPRLVAEVAAALPGVAIELALPAGDDDAVIDALAAFCVRAARDARRRPASESAGYGASRSASASATTRVAL